MRIHITEPGNVRKTYNVSNNTITIGRESNNVIQINDQKISRNHCTITNYGNSMALKDLQSRNGTYLNGRRINSGMAYPITINSGIRIGDAYITFGPGSIITNNIIDKNKLVYQSGDNLPQRVSGPDRGVVPTTNLNLNFEPRGGHPGNEMEAKLKGGVQIKSEFFPLAIILFLCTPIIVIDGVAHRKSWGTHFFELLPGKHTIKIFFEYLFMKECGANSIDVVVWEGKISRVNFYMPPWMFAQGSIREV